MKRIVTFAIVTVAALSLSVLSQRAEAVAVAGNGIPVAASVTTSAGGTAILLANPLRKTLWCENVGTTNPAFVTFGQTPTTTNGFLLVGTATTANTVTASSLIKFPETGCTGQGCVPLDAVNAIATGGTATLVCWED